MAKKSGSAIVLLGLGAAAVAAFALKGGGGSGPPVITRQPQDVTVAVGDVATFTVVATGKQPLHYIWSFDDGSEVDTGPTPRLDYGPVVAADDGKVIQCLVINDLATVPSIGVTLTVTTGAQSAQIMDITLT